MLPINKETPVLSVRWVSDKTVVSVVGAVVSVRDDGSGIITPGGLSGCLADQL